MDRSEELLREILAGVKKGKKVLLTMRDAVEVFPDFMNSHKEQIKQFAYLYGLSYTFSDVYFGYIFWAQQP